MKRRSINRQTGFIVSGVLTVVLTIMIVVIQWQSEKTVMDLTETNGRGSEDLIGAVAHVLRWHPGHRYQSVR